MDFQQWLKDNEKLSDRSISKYNNAIKNISNDMININVLAKNIFDMSNIEFNIAYEKIMNNEDFKIKDTIGHHMYSCALNHYDKYLKSITTNNGYCYFEIPEIRVLPMSEEPDYDHCVFFLSETMKNRGNTYFYKRRSIIVQENTLVLFQFQGQIIAYGLLELDTPIDSTHNMYKEGRTGYYTFKNNSVKILEKPISGQEMKEQFGVTLAQTSSKIDSSLLSKLLQRLLFSHISIIKKEEPKYVIDTPKMEKGEYDPYTIFSNIINYGVCDNSYKLAWAKALVEIASTTSNEEFLKIKFEVIAKLYFKYYWNQILFYGIEKSQRTNKTPIIVAEVNNFIHTFETIHPDTKITFLSEQNLNEFVDMNDLYEKTIKNISHTLSQDVCWRFKIFQKISYDNLYTIDLSDNKTITINGDILKMLSNYKEELLTLIDSRWETLLLR